jgi:hypothetical protein
MNKKRYVIMNKEKDEEIQNLEIEIKNLMSKSS